MGTPPPIAMANIGMSDTIILMVLALVVFGPRRLPQIARQIGKLMYEFRKASNDFKFQMEEELRRAEDADRRQKEEERQKALAAPANSAATTPEASSLSSESAIPSPYPGETNYPYPDQGDPDEGAPSQDDETAAAAEAARLRIEPTIKPPSTGEVVAAERPWQPPPATEPAAGDAANTPPDDAPRDAERSEQAAHHG